MNNNPPNEQPTSFFPFFLKINIITFLQNSNVDQTITTSTMNNTPQGTIYLFFPLLFKKLNQVDKITKKNENIYYFSFPPFSFEIKIIKITKLPIFPLLLQNFKLPKKLGNRHYICK